VTARGSDGKVAWRQRLEHGDRVRLREQFERWPKSTPVVLEGTFGWGWISDELEAAGLDPHLASSRKVAAWRQARGLAKSNRTDADLVSELPFERERWWEVWLAPPEVRDQREWLRYRMTLVRTQTGLKNRIHAIMHRHGILREQSDLFGRDGRRFLSLLVAPQDATLPDSARATLKGYLQLLDHVRWQISAVTREFRKQVKASPSALRLKTIPGIAWILSYTIMAEVGRIERFRSARHLVSYSLLAPLADDSGDEDDGPPKGRHVGHVGRRTLKWAFIEAAHGAVRKGGRFRKTFDRRTNGGKRDKNRGYITVANELCRISYVCWKKQVNYTVEPPPRPGRRKRRRKQASRPELGQPEAAMVAAAE
jgi:transposase